MKEVGTYLSGINRIKLILREGQGGEFMIYSDREPEIFIGADCEDYAPIIEALLHEIDEFTLLTMGCRYARTDQVSPDSTAYLFAMSHREFCREPGPSGTIPGRLHERLGCSVGRVAGERRTADRIVYSCK